MVIRVFNACCAFVFVYLCLCIDVSARNVRPSKSSIHAHRIQVNGLTTNSLRPKTASHHKRKLVSNYMSPSWFSWYSSPVSYNQRAPSFDVQATGTQSCFEYDVEYPNNLYNWHDSIVRDVDCQKLCQRDNKCQGFVFDAHNQKCALSSQLVYQDRHSRPGYVSGPASCHPSYSSSWDMFFNSFKNMFNDFFTTSSYPNMYPNTYEVPYVPVSGQVPDQAPSFNSELGYNDDTYYVPTSEESLMESEMSELYNENKNQAVNAGTETNFDAIVGDGDNVVITDNEQASIIDEQPSINIESQEINNNVQTNNDFAELNTDYTEVLAAPNYVERKSSAAGDMSSSMYDDNNQYVNKNYYPVNPHEMNGYSAPNSPQMDPFGMFFGSIMNTDGMDCTTICSPDGSQCQRSCK